MSKRDQQTKQEGDGLPHCVIGRLPQLSEASSNNPPDTRSKQSATNPSKSKSPNELSQPSPKFTKIESNSSSENVKRVLERLHACNRE
ncbi:hypothetical protein R1flu_023163 [Riccia fluitans]|uniref:Uncharacterized protein n=1 Tax=Riccia fluitans TaxID=41844 RepID=A0ABD1XU92_9MARC